MYLFVNCKELFLFCYIIIYFYLFYLQYVTNVYYLDIK